MAIHDGEAELVLRDVRKTYGSATAVDLVNLEVRHGELLSLLGPSGCGKTTTLRMVAGFIEPTGGSIEIRGQDVTRLAPYKRDTAMVFQNYALFPHLSVFENVAFGLKRRKVQAKQIKQRVFDMLALLELSGLEQRLPRELSGGQQQRVALARALVLNAAVVLLDEPLSNLDAQLRASTRVELRRLQQEFRFTAIFVTHDQEEAMAISDRIAVMNQGRIEQIGTSQEIYRTPVTPFVAQFIGSSNTFGGEVTEVRNRSVTVKTPAGILRGMAVEAEIARLRQGDPARLMVRAEHIQVAVSGESSAQSDQNVITGTIEVASYLGSTWALSVRTADNSLIVVHRVDSEHSFVDARAPVQLSWPVSRSMVFAGI